MCCVDRREAVLRGVDVRAKHLQAVGEASSWEDLHRVGVVHVRRQRRRHEGRAVVCLQPGGVIGDHRVGGGVRLVEAVLGELLHQVEKLHRPAFRRSPFLRAPSRIRSRCLAISSAFLLAHRPAQQVGAAQRIAADDLRDLHHLFLIDDDAVGRFEAGLQVVDEVVDLLLALLAQDEVVDHSRTERPRPVEREHGDDVLEAVGRSFATSFFMPSDSTWKIAVVLPSLRIW
jgi:hypothetical protein